MKKVIVTSADWRMQSLLRYSRPTFETFADRHGYDVLIDRPPRPRQTVVRHLTSDQLWDQKKKRRWRKIELLEKALERYDVVVWFDADILITKYDRDIADDLPADCFQAMVMEPFPHRFNPNTGVWALRGNAEAKRFLRRVTELGPQPHIWADQAAVCVALGWSLGEYKGRGAKPVKASPFLKRTAWLSTEWNPLGLAARWPSRAKHFAGLPMTKRRELMKTEYERLVRTGALKDSRI